MLKKQGIITEDPKYVGDAVFASALPPRKSAPLSAEQTQKLRTLLQSKNPDDLQLANKIIKGMLLLKLLDLSSSHHTVNIFYLSIHLKYYSL